jgi:hypothetical protein
MHQNDSSHKSFLMPEKRASWLLYEPHLKKML